MKYILFLLSLFFCLLSPQPAHAHVAGQPSFFKVNNVYTDFYPVQSNAYLPDFVLPQDRALANYLVNQPLSFEIDTNRLQIPLDALQKTVFLWDFGDGGKSKGLTSSHTYRKQGSYIMAIQGDSTAYDKNIPIQVIQSTIINIVPNQSFKLPQAKIVVNGKSANNPAKNIIPVNATQDIFFDASESKTSDGKISSYYWDFDDGLGGHTQKVNHTYKDTRSFIAPILRIKDSNGFISDTYVVLKVDNKNGTTAPSQTQAGGKKSTVSFLWIAVGFILAVSIIGIMLARKKRN